MPAAAQNILERKLYSITGVEIFSVGDWNNTKINPEDLHDMVRAFNDLKVGWRPCLKLGHDAKQLVAKASGLPAIGWVTNVYTRGDKLLADFDDIPEKVFNLIKQKAYRKVSCEVYFNTDVSGVNYKAILGAVALLGADKPGVMNLQDILGQFEQWENGEVFAILEKQDTFKQYSVNFELNEEEHKMPAIEQLEKDLAEQKKNFEASQAEAKRLQEEQEAKDKVIAELQEFKSKAEAQALQNELKAKEAELEAFVTKLEADKLVTPATKEIVKAILTDVKEFSIGENKAATREEALRELLKLTAQAGKVNFDESSLAEFAKEDKDKQDVMDKKIKEYMAENKCDYTTAYKAVVKSK